MDGMARIAGNEARAPRLEVKNRSERPIKYLEIGWILEDHGGRQFLAGSVPAAIESGAGAKEPDSGKLDLEVPDARRNAAGY